MGWITEVCTSTSHSDHGIPTCWQILEVLISTADTQ